MGSALHGALVLHTMLRRPESSAAAAAFYRTRQQEAIQQHRLWAGSHYAVCAHLYDTPFWRSRALEEEPTPPSESGCIALDSETWLALAPQTKILAMPRVEGNFIVDGQAIQHPTLARPLSYLDGYDVPDLLQRLSAPVRVREAMLHWSGKMAPAKAMGVIAELCRLGVLIRHPQ
jgi:hypothetical protein